MRRATITSAIAALVVTAIAVVPWNNPAGTAASATPVPTVIGSPMWRNLDHTFQRASQDPGPSFSIGYITFLDGIGYDDLFDTPTGATNPPVNETNATLSAYEDGMVVQIVPNSFLPPRPGENNTVQTISSTGIRRIYYDPSPNRDWTQPATFQTGQHVATYEITKETDFTDLAAGIGTGTVEVTLTFSTPFTLASGATFDFAQLGTTLVADFQFQLNSNLTSPDPNFPIVVVHSGVWRTAVA